MLMSTTTNLFDPDHKIGVFRGFSEGGLEFHADILINYKNEYQDMPMHGAFILVELGSKQEAVVGRITKLSPEGRLSSSQGEEFAIRHLADGRPIPEDIKKGYLRYRVSLRVLGILRVENGQLRYAASHRRLPHVGSTVSWPTPDILKFLARHGEKGAPLGFLALGEYIYGGDDPRFVKQPWMQNRSFAVLPTFDVQNLIAKRTFIFARAGFGKSNLNKWLFSQLYKEGAGPTMKIGAKAAVPVGTIVFDADGEYFWPDASGRPGLCDVPELVDRVVVFTRKERKSPYYMGFRADDIRLDIRRLKPKDVIEIALDAAAQSFQNVRKLKGLPPDKWQRLVDLVDEEKNQADLQEIKNILGLDDASSDAEAVAARSNMSYIVNLLHSRRSQLLDKLIQSLKAGKLCIVDISQLRGKAGLTLAGIILQRIFDHNVEEFVKSDPAMIPVIAVIEEAQAVLGGASGHEEGPFIAWVKEGRKYNLGAVLITQQPGSITKEILSQGDNWFVFHLLSSGDLDAVRNANAHFSKDVLSSLLNEPIPGNGVFWSSAKGPEGDIRAYPIPVRIMDFEQEVPKPADPDETKPAGNTFAQQINPEFEKQLQQLLKKTTPVTSEPGPTPTVFPESEAEAEGGQPVDALKTFSDAAIQAVAKDPVIKKRFGNGIPWYGLMVELQKHFPDTLVDDPKTLSYSLVPRLAEVLYGKDGWTTERRQKASGDGTTLWVIPKK
ncbi:MAG TPA: DUF87 domain-containing protein [Candidatus Thermoplasmatota archaeon]|nr:DUF87 domain-containing protein [Candidatus Thermoplasmatota archaeon]